MIQRLRLAGAGFAELRESTVNNGKFLARIGAMTDDVRKLRERLNTAATECANEHRNRWARIMIEAMCALAALEPAADPSQTAAGIVAEIDAILRAPVLPPEQTTALAIEMVRSVLQRTRDEIVRCYDADHIKTRKYNILAQENRAQSKRIAALESQLAAQADRVPREPTTEMMLAGMAVQDENDGQDTAGVWRAMYDAAREGQT